jgi:hypothetical protein
MPEQAGRGKEELRDFRIRSTAFEAPYNAACYGIKISGMVGHIDNDAL